MVDPPMKESMHFFKIILAHTIADKKLKLPSKFVRKFGHELSSVANLVLPSGRNWEVGLAKANDLIWLDDGWHEFALHNSIRQGHFLVFRYERNSTFRVFIMDSSAYEVDYPSESEVLNNGEKEKYFIHKDRKPKQDGSIEVLQDKTPDSDDRANQEAISRNQNESSGQGEALKHQFDGVKLKITRQRVNHRQTESGPQEQQGSPIQDEDIEIYVSRKLFYNSSTPQQRENAIRAAATIQPKNPSFMISLRECYFISATMFVPVAFSTRYLSGVSGDHIKVEHSDGREWNLGFQWKGQKALYLRKGCLEFLRDNDLKEGDVCIFELRDQKAAVLKLSAFRASSS